MLRKTLLSIALLMTLVGLISYFMGDRNKDHLITWGILMFALILFERWRYKKTDDTHQSEWQKTDEQFIDPETGKPMQVFYNSSTGERKYVPREENDGAV